MYINCFCVLVDVHEMAKNRNVLCKQYVSTEKILKSLNILWLFANSMDCSHYLLLPRTDICHQLKAIHNTTKSNCPVEMNICALRMIIGEHDPVDFIFTCLFSCCRNTKSKTAN